MLLSLLLLLLLAETTVLGFPVHSCSEDLFYRMPQALKEPSPPPWLISLSGAGLLCGHHVQYVRGIRGCCEWVSVFVPGAHSTHLGRTWNRVDINPDVKNSLRFTTVIKQFPL